MILVFFAPRRGVFHNLDKQSDKNNDRGLTARRLSPNERQRPGVGRDSLKARLRAFHRTSHCPANILPNARICNLLRNGGFTQVVQGKGGAPAGRICTGREIFPPCVEAIHCAQFEGRSRPCSMPCGKLRNLDNLPGLDDARLLRIRECVFAPGLQVRKSRPATASCVCPKSSQSWPHRELE
jgi:hypothetical protein